MKILYITKGDHIDYQNDCVLIGLKEIYGSDVVDVNKQHHNYTTYDEELSRKLYGMGMSVSRAIPDLDVDRTDITKKIENNFFDLVVYGSIWRCADYIDKVLERYSPNKIIIIDGEDHQSIHGIIEKGVIYFKRELIYQHDRLNPISFALPTSKVNFAKSNKNRDYAICDPRDIKTYIYKTETDYYRGYQESRFGFTMKKAGWDCMRHYEIMGNGCIPFFIDIQNIPQSIMTTFPKQLCANVIEDLKTLPPAAIYKKYIDQLEKHFLENNTTKAMVAKLLNDIMVYER